MVSGGSIIVARMANLLADGAPGGSGPDWPRYAVLLLVVTGGTVAANSGVVSSRLGGLGEGRRRSVGEQLSVDAQLGDGAGHGALHGPEADAQPLGDLGLRHVLVVAQHHRGPHPVRQAVDRPAQRLLQVAVPGMVGDRLVRQLVGRELLYPAAPPPGDV